MTTTEYTNSNVITSAHSENDQSRNAVQIPDGLTPFVRYAETGDDGNPQQLHWLHSLREPVPVVADFVSPVYLLTDEQVAKHDELLSKDDLFRVQDYTSIATKIQTECESDGRVRYPVFIESDADVDYYEMRAGLKYFVRDVLDVDPDDAKWLFSGGSSLHVHLPYYIANEDALRRLRRETKEYNENATVTVDAANFRKKSLFRLPGAEHYDTGIRKTAISPTSSDKKLQARIAQLVGGDATEEERGISYYAGIPEIVRYSLSEELGLIKEIPTPLIEQTERPRKRAEIERWKQYNRPPFSPYANTGNGRRSVVVAQVKGSPFSRKTTVNGREKGRTFVPTYIYSAVSADGEYTVWRENAPLKLSKDDYEKREYNQGDIFVLIGGHNGSSVIIPLEDTSERELILDLLIHDFDWVDGDTDGRRETLDMLRNFGYEVGSAGKNGPRRERRKGNQETEPTDAYCLQRRAEQDDVESLGHYDRLDVANRLLRVREWDGADEWFREQYGERYSQETTHKFLRSVAEEYDDLPTPL